MSPLCKHTRAFYCGPLFPLEQVFHSSLRAYHFNVWCYLLECSGHTVGPHNRYRLSPCPRNATIHAPTPQSTFSRQTGAHRMTTARCVSRGLLQRRV